MKNILSKTAVALLAATALLACNKKDSCKVSFPNASIYLNDWGESATVKINTVNVKYLTVSSATNGWSAEADLASRTVTVTAPESAEAENAARTSVITVSASSPDGSMDNAVLYAYIIDGAIDLSADGTHSNCYVITQPNTLYSFNAALKGESDEPLATADVGIVWQSSSSLVNYLELRDGHARFYVGSDDNGLVNGNALIAAYNSAGNIIWSWHLWFTAEDPRTENISTYSNGLTFMNRNLGAFANSDESTSTDEILASYGLYYQWGRKDPFLRPLYYDCERNVDELAYNSSGSRTYVTVEPTRGTMQYAISHPWIFMSSTSETNGDWLNGSNNNTLWGSAGSKSMYDPCPKGWQVPSKSDFACLELAAAEDNMDLEEARKIFGWHLTDKGTGSKYFYTGAGYRSYFDGILSNINYKDQYPYTPVPWVGYYWTNGTSGTEGVAMFFDLNTTRATINAFESEKSEHRGNAMQIRCVKVK